MQEESKRINMTIPMADYEVIEKELIKKGKFLSVPEYIRHLIKEDLKKRGLIE